ncbi:hypothetical protein U1839_07345 [Sphingomonas sp. RT2P30]|uniref:hypothetical protein n=1 Tax=Parasphingomonas halimpatiens TaxID=3096162 RepID=UPI002FC7DBA0
MDEMRPPPSRYRVIERGGRLIVIDNWAKDGASPVSDAPTTSRPPLAPTGRAPAGTMPSAPDGLLQRLVTLATIGAVDPDGRPFWVTARWYDAKGPRAFALGPAGVRRLGGGLLGVLAVALAVLIGFFVVGVPMILILGALGATTGKTLTAAVTRWIDGFAQLPPD